ncbi:MAG: PH domain-containing protein [Rickettsiales bacterium]|nr:PH domain-containing protein [Rickettsiales bacterium]
MSEENQPELEEDETVIQEIKPSWKAFLFWIVLGVGASLMTMFMLLPLTLIIFAFIFLHMKVDMYTITTERLIFKHGIIARTLEEIELFRIKDVTVSQGFFERLLNIGTVQVLSVDDTTSKLLIKGIDDPMAIKEKLRKMYRASRKKERIVNTELLYSGQ